MKTKKILSVLLVALMAFAVSGFTAFAADDYWNDELYSSIEQVVKANTPKFPDVDFKVTDEKYSALVSDMEEEYFVGSAKKATSEKLRPSRTTRRQSRQLLMMQAKPEAEES